MSDYARNLVASIAREMFTAFIEGGEQAAIDTLDNEALAIANSHGELAFLQEHATAAYRALQATL